MVYSSRDKWYARNLTPMKIGTVPHVVWVHGRDKSRIEPGAWVRAREDEGGEWSRVYIDRIDEHGGIFASR